MTDLTDRMRTCAAHLATASVVANPAAIDDAAALLTEAADMLDGLVVPLPPGEPMEIIPPIVTQNAPPIVKDLSVGQWASSGDTIVANPYRGRHTCPQCDSRAAKTVHRQGKGFVLECSVCGHSWRLNA